MEWKPDPRTSLDIVARMNLDPGQVFLVGDSATDICTAVNAGLIPVGVTWGYRSRQELVENGARHIITQPADLLTLIESQ